MSFYIILPHITHIHYFIQYLVEVKIQRNPHIWELRPWFPVDVPLNQPCEVMPQESKWLPWWRNWLGRGQKFNNSGSEIMVFLRSDRYFSRDIDLPTEALPWKKTSLSPKEILGASKFVDVLPVSTEMLKSSLLRLAMHLGLEGNPYIGRQPHFRHRQMGEGRTTKRTGAESHLNSGFVYRIPMDTIWIPLFVHPVILFFKNLKDPIFDKPSFSFRCPRQPKS